MSKETQWQALKALGFADKACATIMGHAQAESGCECDRLQGDFSAGRERSKAYTAQVDSGQISEHDFVYNGPGGGGYGWLQWTFPARKEGLFDTAAGLGVSIGSEAAAIEWFWNEIHQPEYSVVWKALNSDMSIRGMSDVFMKHFERPADQSENACAHRAKLCEETLEQFGAVSEETAREMAQGLRERSGADIAVATTGIAGPGGGTQEKPVGLVYVACADQNGVRVERLQLRGNRERVRSLAALRALDMVRRAAKGYPESK
jgi:PncC family amidohydrolase